MKQHICREQNSIKTSSKNLDRKLTLSDIASDLLSKVLRISVSMSHKLGTNILRWCSYGMTLKKENQLFVRFLPFLQSTANCSMPS